MSKEFLIELVKKSDLYKNYIDEDMDNDVILENIINKIDKIDIDNINIDFVKRISNIDTEHTIDFSVFDGIKNCKDEEVGYNKYHYSHYANCNTCRYYYKSKEIKNIIKDIYISVLMNKKCNIIIKKALEACTFSRYYEDYENYKGCSDKLFHILLKSLKKYINDILLVILTIDKKQYMNKFIKYILENYDVDVNYISRYTDCPKIINKNVLKLILEHCPNDIDTDIFEKIIEHEKFDVNLYKGSNHYIFILYQLYANENILKHKKKYKKWYDLIYDKINTSIRNDDGLTIDEFVNMYYISAN